MRSLRKIIVWQSLTSHEDKLKVYCYLCHFKFSLGRKDLANKTHKKYEDKTFREEKDIPQKHLAFPFTSFEGKSAVDVPFSSCGSNLTAVSSEN